MELGLHVHFLSFALFEIGSLVELLFEFTFLGGVKEFWK